MASASKRQLERDLKDALFTADFTEPLSDEDTAFAIAFSANYARYADRNPQRFSLQTKNN